MVDAKIKIFDRELCLERFEGDEELLEELLEIYVDDAPNIFARFVEALEKGDLSVAEREAHSMKSASANVGAERVRDASMQAEKAAKAGDRATVERLLEEMQSEFQTFCLALGAL